MNKLIRVFSYILMILGALIVLGGLVGGIFMLLFARGARGIEHSFPGMRMMGAGIAAGSGWRAMFEGLLVSGFGMVLYLLEKIGRPKTNPEPEVPVKPVRARETKTLKK
jgi:hypothetical protein